MTLLAVYEAWKAKNFSGPWCYENFIQARSLRRAQDVRKQLLSTMDKYVTLFFTTFLMFMPSQFEVEIVLLLCES